MIIIVEGPDGSGKTTLVRQLRSWFKDPPFWCLNSTSRFPGNFLAFERWLRWIEGASVAGIHLIFDRFPSISEAVYGPILRNSFFQRPPNVDSILPSLNDHLIRLKLLGPLVILYCRPPTYTIVQQSAKEKQMEGVESHLFEIISRYDWLMDKLPQQRIRVEQVDHKSDLSDLEKDLKDLLKSQESK